jgi:hypothetical protein
MAVKKCGRDEKSDKGRMGPNKRGRGVRRNVQCLATEPEVQDVLTAGVKWDQEGTRPSRGDREGIAHHGLRGAALFLLHHHAGTRSNRCSAPGYPRLNDGIRLATARTWKRLRSWSTGVVQSQVQVIPRPLEYWQCPTLSRRSSTFFVLIGTYDL